MDERTDRPVSVAELTLPGEARSAGVARRFLAGTLDRWGDADHYGGDGAILLSELVTNAALHAKTDIVIHIEQKADCLRIAVTDWSPRQPVVRHYSDYATTGRGLALVSAMASAWGISPHPDGSKTVWAELPAVGNDRARVSPDETSVDLSSFPDLHDSAPGSPAETTGFRLAA